MLRNLYFPALKNIREKEENGVPLTKAEKKYERNYFARCEKECPNADYRTYIVLDATTGQNAISQVEAFDEIIDMDGIILNKLDGTARGGVVFAISAERELPVIFCGVGEGVDDLIAFNPKDFVDGLF